MVGDDAGSKPPVELVFVITVDFDDDADDPVRWCGDCWLMNEGDSNRSDTNSGLMTPSLVEGCWARLSPPSPPPKTLSITLPVVAVNGNLAPGRILCSTLFRPFFLSVHKLSPF